MSRQFKIILSVVAICVIVMIAVGCGVTYFSFEYMWGSPPLDGEKYRNSAQLVKEGMTEEEVITILGKPHERRPRRTEHDGESWPYFTDQYYGNYLGIQFNEQRRVYHTWIP